MRTPGRRAQLAERARDKYVSIRAPVRTPGRRIAGLGDHDLDLFQSAPRCEHRGDPSGRIIAAHDSQVSIRAPVRTPGRLAAHSESLTADVVSIRAPVRTPGRLPREPIFHALQKFQSAPRCEHRGDRRPTPARLDTSQFQSAPRCEHRGDSSVAHASFLLLMFQSAPRCEHRGDWLWYSPQPNRRERFNPRPGANTGATR